MCLMERPLLGLEVQNGAQLLIAACSHWRIVTSGIRSVQGIAAATMYQSSITPLLHAAANEFLLRLALALFSALETQMAP